MKILYITLRADFGGGPKHLDLLLNNLSPFFEIYVACPPDDPFYKKWKMHKKIKDIFLLPHRRFSLLCFLTLYKYIRLNDIMLIHSHGRGAGIYSRFLKILDKNLKVLHTPHGFHFFQYSYMSRFIHIAIERFLSRYTDLIINVSKGERQLFLKYKIYNRKKSVVIYNGILPLVRVHTAKKSLGLNNKTVISTISRFDYPKNMYLAYQIAKRFKNISNICFLWIGDGPERKLLEQKATKEGLNILFIGYVDDKKIGYYLSASDMYLSSSRWEGLPLALIEAQSLGIPIIATDVTGNNEVVCHGFNGFLFSRVDEAVRYINLLLSDNHLYKVLSINSLFTFNSRFHLKKMINRLEELYLSFL